VIRKYRVKRLRVTEIKWTTKLTVLKITMMDTGSAKYQHQNNPQDNKMETMGISTTENCTEKINKYQLL